MRILDFDIECRPLSYLGSDFTTGEVTGIAAAWIVGGRARGAKSWLLGDFEIGDTLEEQAFTMLDGFVSMYDKADMVTGHFIRGYDLPVLNGMLLDNGWSPLTSKLSHDTKNDLKKRKYVSASQENLAAALGIPRPKIHMNQQMWREANRLGREGIALTGKRVVGDVRQHVQMREELLRREWLDKPKIWKSSGALTGAYIP